MREIKFKAWIPALKIMLESVTAFHTGMIGVDADQFEEKIKPNGIYDEHVVDKDGGHLLTILWQRVQ